MTPTFSMWLRHMSQVSWYVLAIEKHLVDNCLVHYGVLLGLRWGLQLACFNIIPARLEVLGLELTVFQVAMMEMLGLELTCFQVIPARLKEVGWPSVLQLVEVGAIRSISAIEAAGQGVHSPDRVEGAIRIKILRHGEAVVVCAPVIVPRCPLQKLATTRRSLPRNRVKHIVLYIVTLAGRWRRAWWNDFLCIIKVGVRLSNYIMVDMEHVVRWGHTFSIRNIVVRKIVVTELPRAFRSTTTACI
jgi:hypothetical protein